MFHRLSVSHDPTPSSTAPPAHASLGPRMSLIFFPRAKLATVFLRSAMMLRAPAGVRESRRLCGSRRRRMLAEGGGGGKAATNAEVEAAGVAVVWGREEEGGAGMRAGGKGGTAAELIEEVVVAAEAGGWGGALRRVCVVNLRRIASVPWSTVAPQGEGQPARTCGVGRPGLGVEMAEALLAASKEESRKEGRKWIGVDSGGVESGIWMGKHGRKDMGGQGRGGSSTQKQRRSLSPAAAAVQFREEYLSGPLDNLRTSEMSCEAPHNLTAHPCYCPMGATRTPTGLGTAAAAAKFSVALRIVPMTPGQSPHYSRAAGFSAMVHKGVSWVQVAWQTEGWVGGEPGGQEGQK
ncbi:unnamed protein product [Closterium sp. NIES-64]|nr:unnamed protein product [Closterium sp. NIES-64]